eukprot:TRINITY_DN19460_c0_g1_i1.p1 TRINITY_DN19460_c0_g1~~TRINITY_DN19460_c0_g1_i1.p1  ORF type:complete len:734 (+),score=67.98 TRINITY_DN19460_c0_g1_i1:69-2270(+)
MALTTSRDKVLHDLDLSIDSILHEAVRNIKKEIRQQCRSCCFLRENGIEDLHDQCVQLEASEMSVLQAFGSRSDAESQKCSEAPLCGTESGSAVDVLDDTLRDVGCDFEIGKKAANVRRTSYSDFSAFFELPADADRFACSGKGHSYPLDVQFDRLRSFTFLGHSDVIHPEVLLVRLSERARREPPVLRNCKQTAEFLTALGNIEHRNSSASKRWSKRGVLQDRLDNPELDRAGFHKLMLSSVEDLWTDDEHVRHDIKVLRTFFFQEADQYIKEALMHHLKKDARRIRSGGCSWEVIPALAIIANSIVIGLAQDVGQGHAAWEWIEVCFLLFYLVEFVVKLRFLGIRRFLRNGDSWDLWNWFDVACLLASAIDLTITFTVAGSEEVGASNRFTLLKILRVARLARLVRTINNPLLSELKVMLLGVLAGLRTLVWAFFLLFIITYALAVTMRIFLGNAYAEFASVPAAMFTIFRCFTDSCDDYEGLPWTERLHAHWGSIFVLVYVVMIMLVTMGIFNLITAVFIENASMSQSRRRQEFLARSTALTTDRLKKQISKCVIEGSIVSKDDQITSVLASSRINGIDDIFDLLDSTGFQVTPSIFNDWVSMPEFRNMLVECDIDCGGQADMSGLFSNRAPSLSLNELVNGLMMLRGPVSKSDTASTHLALRSVMDQLLAIKQAMAQHGNPLGRSPSDGHLSILVEEKKWPDKRSRLRAPVSVMMASEQSPSSIARRCG